MTMNVWSDLSTKSASKKRIVVVANCQGLEIIRYLRSSLNLSCQYDIIYISSIIMMEREIDKRQMISQIASADVVIAQDVTSVEWLRNDYIATLIQKHCRFFRLCFWRFHGYWPIEAEKFHAQMWYVCNEMGRVTDFHDYIKSSVPAGVIARNFAEHVDRFSQIEKGSELKMLPFFLHNHKNHRMFTDEWHPTSLFFFQVARYIVSELDLVDDIVFLPDDGEGNFRHRFILDDVAHEVGLKFDQNFVRFHDANVSRETLFAYFKFAEAHYDRAIPWLHPRENFYAWSQGHGGEARNAEIAQYGKVSVSMNVEPPPSGGRGTIDTIKRRLPSLSAGQLRSRAWSIDLRDFRRISAMQIRLNGVQADRPGTLPLSISKDGQTWKDVAVVRLPHACHPSTSLVLTFHEPLFARYVKLTWGENEHFDVRNADIYMRTIALN